LDFSSQSTRPTERYAESKEFKNDDPVFEIPQLVCARREGRKEMIEKLAGGQHFCDL
jgi:hypothetical protein